VEKVYDTKPSSATDFDSNSTNSIECLLNQSSTNFIFIWRATKFLSNMSAIKMERRDRSVPVSIFLQALIWSHLSIVVAETSESELLPDNILPIDRSHCTITLTIKQLQDQGALSCTNLAPFCDDAVHGNYIRNACPYACTLCDEPTTTASALTGDDDSGSISQSGAIAVMSVGVLVFAALGYASYLMISKRCGGSDLLHQNRPATQAEFEPEWDDEFWTNEDGTESSGTQLKTAQLLDLDVYPPLQQKVQGFSSAIKPKARMGNNVPPQAPPRPSRALRLLEGNLIRHKTALAPGEHFGDSREPQFQHRTRAGGEATLVLKFSDADSETNLDSTTDGVEELQLKPNYHSDNANEKNRKTKRGLDHQLTQPLALPNNIANIVLMEEPTLDHQVTNVVVKYAERSAYFAGRTVYDWSDVMVPGEQWEKANRIVINEVEASGEYHNVVGEQPNGPQVKILSHSEIESWDL